MTELQRFLKASRAQAGKGLLSKSGEVVIKNAINSAKGLPVEQRVSLVELVLPYYDMENDSFSGAAKEFVKQTVKDVDRLASIIRDKARSAGRVFCGDPWRKKG